MPPNKGGRGGKGGRAAAAAAATEGRPVGRAGAEAGSSAVRLGERGVAPASRNHEGVTTFQLCARDGLEKSLAEMVRWYERRAGELLLRLAGDG